MRVSLHVMLQVVGMAVLLVAAGYWVTTGNQSSLFVGAALSLIALGAYQGMREDLAGHLEMDER